MKTLFKILIAGALSATGVFAEAVAPTHNVAGNDNTIATPRLPVRLFHKRSAVPQAAGSAPKVNLGTPGLPFRLYQKVPLAASSNKPSGIETAKRQQ